MKKFKVQVKTIWNKYTILYINNLSKNLHEIQNELDKNEIKGIKFNKNFCKKLHWMIVYCIK